MVSAQVLWVYLLVFTLFTLMLGVGLQLYQTQIMALPMDDGVRSTAGQAALVGILFMFTAGAVLFLISAARWVARRED